MSFCNLFMEWPSHIKTSPQYLHHSNQSTRYSNVDWPSNVQMYTAQFNLYKNSKLQYDTITGSLYAVQMYFLPKSTFKKISKSRWFVHNIDELWPTGVNDIFNDLLQQRLQPSLTTQRARLIDMPGTRQQTNDIMSELSSVKTGLHYFRRMIKKCSWADTKCVVVVSGMQLTIA